MKQPGFRVVKFLDLADLVEMSFWLATVRQTHTFRGDYAIIYFDSEQDAVSFRLKFCGTATDGPEYLNDY